MSIMPKPHFHYEEATLRFVDGLIWANGPVCPTCGGVDHIGASKADGGKHVRCGLNRCSQFALRRGTLFEESNLRRISGCKPLAPKSDGDDE